MIKKSFRIVLAVLLAFSCIFTLPVLAESDSDIAPLSVVTASQTVSDSAGNRFFVTGTSYRSTSNCVSTTTFETTFYREGTEEAKRVLDNRAKTLTAAGTVSMVNGASTRYSGSSSPTGATGSYSKSSDTLLYYPVLVSGTHSFSCNGASWSGASSDNLLN